jgi:hypothetical protein
MRKIVGRKFDWAYASLVANLDLFRSYVIMDFENIFLC